MFRQNLWRFVLVILIALQHWLFNGPSHGPLSGRRELASRVYHVQAGRRNSPAQQNKPYVVMISLDGFRHDYLDNKPQVGIFLRGMFNLASSAEGLRPGFPSSTFPNHYSIVTGLYPGHHGVVANRFYDPRRDEEYNYRNKATVRDGSWYKGTPLWVAAERAGMLSASFFWVGSEAEISGYRPTYYYNFDDSIAHKNRVLQVRNWLSLPEDLRPHLVTLYFSEVDRAGHQFGPNSRELDAAIDMVDYSLRELVGELIESGLPINVVIVSDHGMMEIEDRRRILFKKLAPRHLWSAVRIQGSGPFFMLYVKEKLAAEKLYAQLKQSERHYRIFRREEAPAHYRAQRAPRMGDYLLVADPPFVFEAQGFGQKLVRVKGDHGWDPEHAPEVGGIFLAWGPNIRAGQRLPVVDSVDVYPFVMQILGLPIPPDIDGRVDALSSLIIPSP